MLLVGTLTTTAMICPRALHVAQRGERVGGLARLADEQRQPTFLQHRIAITELARDIDIDRHARELLEPVFRRPSRRKSWCRRRRW
jgi:hypothetical protein